MLFASDTSPEARALVIERLRRMTPAQRFAATAGLVEFGLRLARQAAQESCARRGAAGAERVEFFKRWLGEPLARQVVEYERREADAP